MNSDQQLETMIEACRVMAEILKDPTEGGTVEMTSDQRNHAREEAYNNIIELLDSIEAINEVAQGFVHALNIVNTSKGKNEK